MTKSIDPSTPQFRTSLSHKIKNIEPDYDVEILDSKRGFAFRMIDSAGRHRSEIINIYVNNGHALDRSKLEWLLRPAEFPKILKS
jgi:hypothetical protein